MTEMRKVFIKTLKHTGAFTLPEISDGWEGPFLFHEWGSINGDTRGILECPKTGEVIMHDPGFMKFETGGKNEVSETQENSGQKSPGSR